MSTTDIGRKPLTIVELEQPRCSNRFGALPCTAGLGNLDVSVMSYNFIDAPLASEYDPFNVTLSAAPAGFGVRITQTGSLPFIRITGDASTTFSGSTFPFVIVRGIWRSGTIANFALRWYNDAGYIPTASGVVIADVFDKNGNTLDASTLSGGQEFLAVFDVSTVADYAAEWVGQTIDGLRLDFIAGSSAVLDIQQIQATENTFPVTARPCYNTAGTCVDLPNLNSNGSIRWRFTDDRPGVRDYADYSDADNPATNAFPCGVNVTTSASEINTGANLEGRSPLGVTGKVTIGLKDFPWNDAVGDFSATSRTGYVAGRAYPTRGPFWALWTARNALYNDMFLRIYDGYEGEALGDMRQRLFTLDNVSGPTSDGAVSLTGLDPLRDADDAEFPRTSDLDLFGDIDDTTTSITVFGLEADVSDSFGNTGTTRYLSIGNELISYIGYSDEGDGQFLLSGVIRGALNSEASSHADQDKVQRAGRYEDMQFWLVLNDLFVNHTTIPTSFIPLADWNTEGNVYLPTYRATHTVVNPTKVSTLAGQLTQQGLFYIWWEPYDQEIKLLAVRAPNETPAVLTDELNLIRGTQLTRDPDIRLTQVAVYYNQINPFSGEKDQINYRNRYTAIDGENLGDVIPLSIYAPWIRNRTQAVQLAVRLLIRYKNVPKFLSVTIDAKDRAVVTGSVADIETAAILDSEGNLESTRWQVISFKEVKAGHTYMLNLQTYEFVGRFGRYMADGSPDFADATDAEKAVGAWYADDFGLLSDGTEGYKYQ